MTRERKICRLFHPSNPLSDQGGVVLTICSYFWPDKNFGQLAPIGSRGRSHIISPLSESQMVLCHLAFIIWPYISETSGYSRGNPSRPIRRDTAEIEKEKWTVRFDLWRTLASEKADPLFRDLEISPSTNVFLRIYHTILH
jgi:hypothetical protein